LPKLPENCPVCGEKTEEGWLVHPWHFRWSSSKEKSSWWVQKHYVTEGTEDLTKRDSWGIKGSAVRAYRCLNCIVYSVVVKKRKKSDVCYEVS